MQKNKYDVLTRYIENLGNITSGGVAAIAGSLFIKDSKFLVENFALSATLFSVSLVIYFIFAAIVIARTKTE